MYARRFHVAHRALVCLLNVVIPFSLCAYARVVNRWACYSGVNCEQAPDFCASNPCGGVNNDDDGNTCVSLSWDSPLPYYCVCGENEKYFGMSCETNKVKKSMFE